MTHVTWHMTHDTGHRTHDLWHMTHKIWHMTHDTWHMVHERWHMTLFYGSCAAILTYSEVLVSPVCRVLNQVVPKNMFLGLFFFIYLYTSFKWNLLGWVNFITFNWTVLGTYKAKSHHVLVNFRKKMTFRYKCS